MKAKLSATCEEVLRLQSNLDAERALTASAQSEAQLRRAALVCYAILALCAPRRPRVTIFFAAVDV